MSRTRRYVLLLAFLLIILYLPGASAEEIEGCDFAVTGNGGTYTFDVETGVLTITGDCTVAMKDGVSSTGQSIIVAADATVTLDGINIQSAQSPAILIQSPHTVELVLAEGSENTVVGGHSSNSDDWAGIEVEFEYEGGENPANQMASLIISGEGTLTATGGSGAAGIGGSRSMNGSRGNGLYGNITINGGTVNAASPGDGAGIGSSNNPGDGTSSGSYKKTGNNTWGTITINDGTVTAVSQGRGAGIGGGNHVDSGKIVINGGTINAEGDSGIGCGIGSSNPDGTAIGDKGPGFYYADITINGGTVTAHASNCMGAGIGGGMYSDAYVTITGGTIEATVSQGGNLYQGGAGIGGGYQGAAIVNIEGGEIIASGGHGAPGIGNGAGASAISPKTYSDGVWSGTKKIRTGLCEINGEDSCVNISGGIVKAFGGQYGAGIGSGNFSQWSNVNISGGTVYAVGDPSSEGEKYGGAGIGSGVTYAPSKIAYMVETSVNVTITGGDVVAIGGWGAAGIGSGANNKMADYIEIDAETADLEAYADGTKFAIDTRLLQDDGTTRSSADENPDSRVINGCLLQGTFVHEGEIGDYEQNPEGLRPIIVTNDKTGESKELTLMPDGYRSYAANVAQEGVYTVYTDAESIGAGQGRYFAVCPRDVWSDEAEIDNLVQYTVDADKLSDNFYLFPVKSIIVQKETVFADDDLKEGLNTTLYFAISWKDDTGTSHYITDSDDNILMVEIEVADGEPQTKGYFVGVQDRKYDVWEMTRDGEKLSAGAPAGALVVTRISTKHGEDASNNATIDDEVWTDTVTVVNEYDTSKTSITATKVWDDEDNQYSTRADVTFLLKADGETVADSAKTIAADAEDDDRTVTWENLPKYTEDGDLITYTVEEDGAENGRLQLGDAEYTVTVEGDAAEGFVITNAYAPIPPCSDDLLVLKEISGDKPDTDEEFSFTLTAFSNTVELDPADMPMPGGSDGTVKTITAKAGAEAKFGEITFDKEGTYVYIIAEKDSGLAGYTYDDTVYTVTYDITESADGYKLQRPVRKDDETVDLTSFTFTNRYKKPLSITVTKVWDDVEDKDSLRPESVTVRLFADAVETASAELAADNKWTFTFAELPAEKDGTAIRYTVKEDAVPDYETTITGSMEAGFTVTNTHEPTPEEESSVPEEESSAPEEESSVPEEESSAPEEESSVPEEESSAPEEESSVPEEESSAPEEESSAPEEESSAPEEESSAPEEESSAPEEESSVPEEESSAPEEESSVPEESSTPEEASSVPEESSANDSSKDDSSKDDSSKEESSKAESSKDESSKEESSKEESSKDDSSKPSGPATGDSSHLIRWILLTSLALVGFAVTLVRMKKAVLH